MRGVVMLVGIVLAGVIGGGAASAPGDDTWQVVVRPLQANGLVLEGSYVCLWRAAPRPAEDAIAEGVTWAEAGADLLWHRVAYSHPSYPRDSESDIVFDGVAPGRYRVSVANAARETRPDPTPFGATDVFALSADLGAGERTHRVEVRTGSGAHLTVRTVDATNGATIDGVALRLFDASGMPVVAGRGTATFVDGTRDDGTMTYAHLAPATYFVEVQSRPARLGSFIDYTAPQQRTAIRVGPVPTVHEVRLIGRPLTTAAIDTRFQFSVHGRVTDTEGRPLANVEVRAATGFGTLLGGGRALTDDDGRYRLHFGPGGRTRVDPDTAPLGIGTQAASFFASKSGWFEVNLCRGGDLLMSDAPAGRDLAETWGHAAEDVIRPGVPRELDFVMQPAAVLTGELRGARPRRNVEFFVDGPELPPSSSILTTFTTDDRGRFRVELPVGFDWRIGMRLAPTRSEIRTGIIRFDTPGEHRGGLRLDTEEHGADRLSVSLTYVGPDGAPADPR